MFAAVENWNILYIYNIKFLYQSENSEVHLITKIIKMHSRNKARFYYVDMCYLKINYIAVIW